MFYLFYEKTNISNPGAFRQIPNGVILNYFQGNLVTDATAKHDLFHRAAWLTILKWRR
jgi:hypothetical protein